MLLTSFSSYLAFSNPVSPDIRLDDLPSQAAYTLKTDGTNYWAVRYDGYKASESTTAATVLQYAITGLASTGGLIHIVGKFPITVNIAIPSLTSDLVIEGEGFRTAAITVSSFASSKSILAFSGARITNSLGSDSPGRLIIRDLGMSFTGVSRHALVQVDRLYPIIERVKVVESGNTFSAGESYAVFGSETPNYSPPTPAGQFVVFRDIDIYMGSAYAIGFYLHFEPVLFDNIGIGFNANGQRGFIVAGAGTGATPNHITTLHTWWSSAAEGCTLFVPENSGKCLVADQITFATQAGAGDVTPNAVFNNRTEWSTPTRQNFVINSVTGCDSSDVNWGTTPDAPVYLWKNSILQSATHIEIFNNKPTQRYGSSSISDSSTTFNHNLPAAPIFVSASFNAIGWTSWKWNASATQITITVETSGDYDVYWYASATY